jgi:hypothetical protein
MGTHARHEDERHRGENPLPELRNLQAVRKSGKHGKGLFDEENGRRARRRAEE